LYGVLSHLQSFPTRRSSDLDIAESVGSIEVSLSLAGCANSWEIACADGDDFNIDFPKQIEFNHASSSYVLNIRDDVVVEHKEKRSEEHTSELQSRENLVCRL